MDLGEISLSTSPYPGLRSFQRHESDIFFGREEQTDQLLERLQSSHFLAVVGPSGCGKSSLVRAGLMASLETGFLADAGAKWRLAEMRPGEQPLSRLAEALRALSALGPELASEPDAEAFLLTTLGCGPLGLIEVLRDYPLPQGANLILLVDQFEEIFRFRSEGNIDKAEAFVALLLETARQREVPVYVVITMRSDFLGECALFSGLPEAINDSQYLTPRLTREQYRSAITGPARVFGGEIQSALANRLINDMGPDPDQLPLLQHLLMRLWARVSGELGQEATGRQDFVKGIDAGAYPRAITLDDYMRIGTLDKALSNHADEVLAELSEEQQRITEVLFRRLTERSLGQRDIRRPARLIEVAEVAGVTEEEVMAIVEEFRRPDRSFITPPPPTLLFTGSILDIGHESLIRQWERLNEWVNEEARSAEMYLRLKQTAHLWKSGEADLWGSIDLDRARAWKAQQKPTPVWAARYGTDEDFETSMKFLDASDRRWQERIQQEKAKSEALAEAERRRIKYLKIILVGLCLGLVILAGLAIFMFKQRNRANWLAQKSAEQAAKAYSQKLATKAIYQSENDPPDLTMLLSAEAYSTYPTFEARKALLNLAEKYSGLRGFLYGHTASVQSVAFSPDGRILASGGFDKKIRFWNVESCKEEGEPLANDSGEVNSIAFSPNSKMLASGDQNNNVTLWNVETRKPIQLKGHKGSVLSIAFSPDGKLLASSDEKYKVLLWDVETSKLLHKLGGHSDFVNTVAFSPDGSVLASGSKDRTIRLWDVKTHKQIGKSLTGQNSTIYSIAFSPDGSVLASGGENKSIWLWDVKTHKPKGRPLEKHQAAVLSVAFSPDGRILASGSDDETVQLWDVENQTPLGNSLTGHQNYVQSLAFSPDGKKLATGSGDGKIQLWNITTLLPLNKHTNPVLNVAFSPDGRILASGGIDWSIRLWDVATHEPIGDALTGHQDIVKCIAYSPDGQMLASGSNDRTIRLWDIARRETVAVLSGSEGIIEGIAFSPDGRVLASGGYDKTIRLWDVASHEEIAKLTGPQGYVRAVAFSPDGKTLAAGGDDKTIRFWDVETRQPLGELPIMHKNYVSSIAFSPDGQMLASGGKDDTVLLWSIALREPIGNFNRPLGYVEFIARTIAFSPDGEILAATRGDYSIELWDVKTQLLLGRFSVGQTHAKHVAFSRDGKMLAGGFNDNTIRLWDVNEASWKERAVQMANRDFEDEERRLYLKRD